MDKAHRTGEKILTYSLVSKVLWNKQDETCPDSYWATIIQRGIVLVTNMINKTGEPLVLAAMINIIYSISKTSGIKKTLMNYRI